MFTEPFRQRIISTSETNFRSLNDNQSSNHPNTNIYRPNSSSFTGLISQINSYNINVTNEKQRQALINSLLPNEIPVIYKSPSSIPSQLDCPICYEILSVPVRLYCGHTYCHKCLQVIIEGEKIAGSRLTDDRTCPICRQIIDKEKLGKDRIAEGILEELQVLCPRQQCRWEGIKKDLEQHYTIDCLFKKSLKQKPLWHKVFPEHAPQEHSTQTNPVMKGSLLAGIYQNNPEIHRHQSFQQFQNSFDFKKPDHNKRQQYEKKQRQQKSLQSDNRLQQHIRTLEEFEELCRQKTPQQLQKQFLDKQKERTRLRMEKRKKNMNQLKKLLHVKNFQNVQEQKRLQQQKKAYLQKQRLKQLEEKKNFQEKLNCIQRLISIRKQSEQQSNNDQILNLYQTQSFAKSVPNSQEILHKNNSGQNKIQTFQSNATKNSTHQSKNPRGLLNCQASYDDMQMFIKGSKDFKPYKQHLNAQQDGYKPYIFNRYNGEGPRQIINHNFPEKSSLIIPHQNPNITPDYMKKPHMYAATYQKHRLVRKPYVPPADQSKIPQKLPTRYYTNFSQFSDPEYLKSDIANRRGQYAEISQSTGQTKKKFVGTTNLRFK